MELITATPESPLGGLCRDTELSNQPQGTSPFTLNGVFDSSEGSQGTVVNENANRLCLQFPEGYVNRGIIPLDGHRQVFLGYAGNLSYVFLANLEKCTWQAKLISTCADLKYPITGEHRVVKGCEDVIYWRDGVNPDRYLNLTKAEDDNPDCNLLRLNPDVKPVGMDLVGVNDIGGYLKVGTYAIQLEYLTGNEEVVYRSYISPTVPVIDEPLNLAYDALDGALNLEDNLPDIGGVPVTNKSITFRLFNLDSNFQYYRINVVAYTSSDGLTPAVYRTGALFPVQGDEAYYTVTGFNPGNGDTLVDYASINVPAMKYENSRVMEQVQGRMLRGNLKESPRDYSHYQGYANQITSRPVVQEVQVNNQLESGDPKNPRTYWDRVGYQSDEVYAFGIVYVYSNGDESPVFHIPGREADATDLEELEIGVDVPVEDVRHLGITSGTVPRWKVFNTGSPEKMAYHESDAGLYPTTRKCGNENEYVYGINQGKKVRHHRFPSRKDIPLTLNDTAFILGIEFDDIAYPDPDIVGHYIVRAKRDNLNRTVLDSGYLGQVPDDTVFEYVIPDFENNDAGIHLRNFQNFYYADPFYSQNLDTKYSMFFSPRNIYQKEYLTGSHLSTCFVNTSEPVALPGGGFDFYEIANSNNDLAVLRGMLGLGGPFIVKEKNYKIDAHIFCGPLTDQKPFGLIDKRVINDSITTSFDLYKTSDSVHSAFEDLAPTQLLFGSKQFAFAYLKALNDVHFNLTSIIYYRTHSGYLTGSSSKVFGGDVFVSEFKLVNMCRIQRDEYVSGSDIIVETSDRRILAEYFSGLYVESEVNCGYRVGGSSRCNRVYNGNLEFEEYVLDKLTFGFENGNYLYDITQACPEYYKINPDLNRLQCDTTYVPLWLSYDYCSKCRLQYRTRIAFSEKAFQNDLGDNYRVYLANNFVDLPSNRGAITSMNFRSNKLIVRCEHGLYILFPNPQMLRTDENSVYIGTGDFLSLPENEMMVSDSGYAGQQCVHAECVTPYGVVWADQERGKVFMFDDNLEEISRYKMYHWFEQNLKPFLKQDFESLGLEYNPDEFGLRMTYDPKFERVIIHKRDYRLTQQGRNIIANGITKTLMPGGIQVDSQFLAYSNHELFENKGWTASYSIRTKVWLSWHSYQPSYMSYGASTFYSTLGNQVWAHDDYHRFHEFFGKRFPFIIEYVDKQVMTMNAHAIHYWASAHSWDGESMQWNEDDVTFDKAVFYTHDQSSGLMELAVPASEFETIGWSNASKPVIRTDKNWKVAQLRDLTVSSPVNSAAWQVVQGMYDGGQGYMEKLPVNVDFGKQQHELNEFREKWLACQFWFTRNDRKLVANVFVTNKYPSVR